MSLHLQLANVRRFLDARTPFDGGPLKDERDHSKLLEMIKTHRLPLAIRKHSLNSDICDVVLLEKQFPKNLNIFDIVEVDEFTKYFYIVECDLCDYDTAKDWIEDLTGEKNPFYIAFYSGSLQQNSA